VIRCCAGLRHRRPFRLWGIPEFAEGAARIEAVDLHVGHRLRLDVDQNWLRIYLERGSCGNSVARLVSNQQHHFNAALSLIDPELDAAMNAGSPSAPADQRRERTPSR
jgi:hypothetical protein